MDNGNVSYSTFTDCLEGGRPKMEVWAMEVRGGGSIQEKNIVNNDYDSEKFVKSLEKILISGGG